MKANESYTITSIPDGEYILYYSLGKDWNKDTGKFSIVAEYECFEETFSFERGTDFWGRKYHTGYEVTLYPVAGGTAETEDVSEGDFPKLNQ
jgi:hypothetical protein